MSLTDRLVDTNPDPDPGPEDLLASSLSVIFPDTVANQHGDATHALFYASPHLPRQLRLDLADPHREEDRLLFGHYLWNASLLVAELVERGSLGELAGKDGRVSEAGAEGESQERGVGEKGRETEEAKRPSPPDSTFDVRGKSIIELGAGTALTSTMAALLGAAEVVVTDYPSPSLLTTLRANVARNITKENSPRGYIPPKVEVLGHSWGDLEGLEGREGSFDLVIAADCLVSALPPNNPVSTHIGHPLLTHLQWMPWQHQNLLTSTSHLLKRSPSSRAWVIAGFHTGRPNMRGFFDASFLHSAGLEAEHLYEVDCMGVEREWVWEREGEDLRRWCVVGILKWIDP